MNTEIQRQLSILKTNTVNFISEELFCEILKKSLDLKKPLRIKFGADPTAPDIHLGHMVILNKLRQFQNFGHTVDFIIGDFTAMIGDPSGKSETRKPLNREQVQLHAKTYQEQIFKILDKEKTNIIFNSSWFNKMNFKDVLKLTSSCSVARMLERDDFSKRYKSGQSISIVEFLYPLMQGYDSVMLDSDIELGGTDQTFNLLVGRDLQRDAGQKEQVIITMPILEGTDGVQKMSKSLNNYIGIAEQPKDIFGKVMSISDNLMFRYLRLLTDRTENDVADLENNVKNEKIHPMELKKELARELVTKFYDKTSAVHAEQEFTNVFSKKNLPEDMPVIKIKDLPLENGKIWVCRLLHNCGLTKSTSDARRMIQQGAVQCNGEKILSVEMKIVPEEGMILKVGKRRFAKISQ
ncbi:tyrosine--tRNA ligase [bacterium]|nr:tyrosine--tRNA ligase [bacterium]